MSLKTIIVEDELPSLQNLRQKIIEFCPDLNIIGTASLPEEAILLIENQKPHVIFLDIEMPRMNGFKMLDEIRDHDFDIVFTTAYNHYAIDAIRISAFDYLVKPISVGDLQNTVSRLMKKNHIRTAERLEVLRQGLSESRSQHDKITINTTDGVEFLEISNIIYVESSSNYCKIYLQDGGTLMVPKLLKDFEELLSAYRFFRIHNSYLINLNYLRKYIRGDGGQVVLENGKALDVSRRRKEDFLKIVS